MAKQGRRRRHIVESVGAKSTKFTSLFILQTGALAFVQQMCFCPSFSPDMAPYTTNQAQALGNKLGLWMASRIATVVREYVAHGIKDSKYTPTLRKYLNVTLNIQDEYIKERQDEYIKGRYFVVIMMYRSIDLDLLNILENNNNLQLILINQLLYGYLLVWSCLDPDPLQLKKVCISVLFVCNTISFLFVICYWQDI